MQKLQHSVKVPQLYKAASKIAKKVKEEGGSLKDLVFNCNRHLNIKAIYALILKTFQHEDVLDRVIHKSNILIKEEGADPWLIRVLVTELLFGRKHLPGNSKPVQTVLTYHPILIAELRKAEKKGILRLDSEQRKDDRLRFVRVNTLIFSVADALKYFHDEGWTQIYRKKTDDYLSFLHNLDSLAENQFTQDFHIKELLIFPKRTEFFGHELYLNGSIILQDKASCLASWLLKPPPGSITLDMCASPGMKTTHLASLMENKGTLYAVEMNEKRYQTLCKQLKISGAKCVTTLHKDALSVDADQCPGVQYILVDPSCSGSGMVGRPVFKNEGKESASRLEKLAGFQIMLLRHALTKFTEAKRVVYSTCSVNVEENEQVVEQVLTSVNTDVLNPLFQVVENNIKENWIHYGSQEFEFGPRCLYAKPNVDFTNGFFIAVFERVGCVVEGENIEEKKKCRNKKKQKANIMIDDYTKIEVEEDKCKWSETIEENECSTFITDEKNEEVSIKRKKKIKHRTKISEEAKTKVFEGPESKLDDDYMERKKKKKKKKKCLDD